MWDERVDQAIDEEARRATDGTPSAGFAARVHARIEAHDAPRSSWRAAWILTPVALAAAIVMAVVVVHERGDRTTVRLEPDTSEAAAAIVRPGSVRLQAERRDPGSVGVEADRRNPGRGRVRAEGSAGRTSQPPDMDPLYIAPLNVDRLTPAPLAIERLDAIAPIDVAPLDITDAQRRFE